jgi:hypothetical protein
MVDSPIPHRLQIVANPTQHRSDNAHFALVIFLRTKAAEPSTLALLHHEPERPSRKLMSLNQCLDGKSVRAALSR